MLGRRRGERWTVEENRALLEAYRAGIPIAQIARKHQRSEPAIHRQLIRLRAIESENKPGGNATATASTRAWTYMLLSERGEVYLGATTNLRKRIRSHNSPDSTQWTRGRLWHPLAAQVFSTAKEAFALEREMKKNRSKKAKWKRECIERALRIARRHGYGFSPISWARKPRSNTV